MGIELAEPLLLAGLGLVNKPQQTLFIQHQIVALTLRLARQPTIAEQLADHRIPEDTLPGFASYIATPGFL